MRTLFNLIYKSIINKLTAFYLCHRSKILYLKKIDILDENRKRNEDMGTLILNTYYPATIFGHALFAYHL